MRQVLTVTIPTFNRAENLKNCLQSLSKQADRNFEVVVIDGGSTDETTSVIKRFKRKLRICLIIDKTPHLAYIRDLGWRKAKGEIVAWIDDDVVVSSGWVKAVKSAFKDRKVGGVTGPTVIPKKLIQDRDIFFFHTTKNPFIKIIGEIYFHLFMQGEKYAIGKIYPSGAWSPGSNFSSSLKLKKPIQVDYLEACNFAVKRSILKKIDGYDLNYKDTSEWCEVDLAFRIRKAGYKLIFDPKIAVEHHISKAGVFKRRLSFVHRLYNLVYFFIYSYYPKKPWGFFQFALYLNTYIAYWFYLELRSLKKLSVEPYGWIHLLESYKKYVKKTDIVLEIGSSNIQNTRDLSSYCRKVIGVELLPEFTPKNFKNIKYITGDWQDLSKFIRLENIDLIVASHVIEHMKGDLHAIDELYRVLKPGGVALLATPNRKRLTRTIIEMFTGERKFPWHEHEREYIENDLLKLIRLSKFKKFKIISVVLGLHAGPVYIYLKSVPRLLRKYANFWEIHLFK